MRGQGVLCDGIVGQPLGVVISERGVLLRPLAASSSASSRPATRVIGPRRHLHSSGRYQTASAPISPLVLSNTSSPAGGDSAKSPFKRPSR